MKLRVNNIYKSFGNLNVLNDLSIYVDENELISILGISGSGKTTLFNIISGLLRADSGSIYLDGLDITGQTGKLSYMLQKDLLLAHMSVIDNVCLPLFIKKEAKKVAHAKALPLLKEFGLGDVAHKYPHQLSGGMRQRVALLRTYMTSKELILLDEPFSALDAITKSEMHTWFIGIIKKLGITGIFISHDIDEAIFLSNRIYILASGKINKEIIIKEAFPRDNSFKLSQEFLNYKKEIINSL